mgnify:CR=1 FL=1
MNILEIIEKKREKQELTNDEIKYFVDAYVNEQIADYQAAALIMAIFINGMSDLELYDLTFSMANYRFNISNGTFRGNIRFKEFK